MTAAAAAVAAAVWRAPAARAVPWRGRGDEAGSNGRRRRRGTGRLESEVRCSRARIGWPMAARKAGRADGGEPRWRRRRRSPSSPALVGALFFSFLASCCA